MANRKTAELEVGKRAHAAVVAEANQAHAKIHGDGAFADKIVWLGLEAWKTQKILSRHAHTCSGMPGQ